MYVSTCRKPQQLLIIELGGPHPLIYKILVSIHKQPLLAIHTLHLSFTHMHTRIPTQHSYICTHVRTHMHACTHTRVHAHTHTHTHTHLSLCANHITTLDCNIKPYTTHLSLFKGNSTIN